MRIQSTEHVESSGIETTSREEVAALRAQRAEDAALAKAGVTAQSGFTAEAAAGRVAQVALPPPDPAVPTVRASQLANGTATLAQTGPEVRAPPLFRSPADPANLVAITSGAGGVTPLSREQVVQTITAAVPQAAAMIAAGVTDESLAQAFSQVIEARATPGTKDVAIALRGFESRREMQDVGESTGEIDVISPAATTTELKASVSVGTKGEVNGQPLAADVATANDYKPYPDGNSTDNVKLKFDVVGDPGNLASLTAAHGNQPALSRQAVVDTILAVAPEARAVIAAGVTDDSLARAFSQVIEARNTPGEKSISLDLVALESRTETTGYGEYTTETKTVVPADRPTTFSAKMSVGEGGTVNGASLPADVATRITGARSRVPQEFKDTTLRELGLSEEWLGNATQEQKDYALARIIEAKETPGHKQLDFSFGYTVLQGNAEGWHPQDVVAAGIVNLNVGADGRVNGKPLTAEVAFNATRTVEKMSNAVRRVTLMSLGFNEGAVANASADQEKYVLVKASVATITPGTAEFEAHMGGDKYAVGLKVDQDGTLEPLGVKKLIPPPKKKKSWLKKIVSVALSIGSFFPATAVFCQAAKAVMAVADGAKGLGLLGAVVGLAIPMADFGGYAGLASTLSNVSTAVSAVKVGQSLASGDFLGALSGAASMAGGFAGGDLGETLSTIGTAAAGARAIQTGDIEGLLSAGLRVGAGLTSGDTAAPFSSLARIGTTVGAAASGKIADALTGVLDLSSLRGVLVPRANEAGAFIGAPDLGEIGASLSLPSLSVPSLPGGFSIPGLPALGSLGSDLSGLWSTIGHASTGNVGAALDGLLNTVQGGRAVGGDVTEGLETQTASRILRGIPGAESVQKAIGQLSIDGLSNTVLSASTNPIGAVTNSIRGLFGSAPVSDVRSSDGIVEQVAAAIPGGTAVAKVLGGVSAAGSANPLGAIADSFRGLFAGKLGNAATESIDRVAPVLSGILNTPGMTSQTLEAVRQVVSSGGPNIENAASSVKAVAGYLASARAQVSAATQRANAVKGLIPKLRTKP